MVSDPTEDINSLLFLSYSSYINDRILNIIVDPISFGLADMLIYQMACTE